MMLCTVFLVILSFFDLLLGHYTALQHCPLHLLLLLRSLCSFGPDIRGDVLIFSRHDGT